MNIVCAVCLYVPSDRVTPRATTIIEGYAVCDDHRGVVATGERFEAIQSVAAAEVVPPREPTMTYFAGDDSYDDGGSARGGTDM